MPSSPPRAVGDTGRGGQGAALSHAEFHSARHDVVGESPPVITGHERLGQAMQMLQGPLPHA